MRQPTDADSLARSHLPTGADERLGVNDAEPRGGRYWHFTALFNFSCRAASEAASHMLPSASGASASASAKEQQVQQLVAKSVNELRGEDAKLQAPSSSSNSVSGGGAVGGALAAAGGAATLSPAASKQPSSTAAQSIAAPPSTPTAPQPASPAPPASTSASPAVPSPSHAAPSPSASTTITPSKPSGILQSSARSPSSPAVPPPPAPAGSSSSPLHAAPTTKPIEITPSKPGITPAPSNAFTNKKGTSPLTPITSPFGNAVSAASPTPTAAAAAGAAETSTANDTTPVPISVVLKAAATDISSAAQAGIATAKALAASFKNKKQPFNITLDQLIAALFFSGLAIQVLLMRIFSPSALTVASSTLLGLGLGLALSFMYYNNKKEKEELNQMLGLNIGIKGLKYLVGVLPSWLNYTEHEKIEWFNSMLVELWPFVDRAVCAMIKTTVEGICADVIRTQKVPIKKVGFKQLTFGDAPFRVEHIWVNESNAHGMEMDVGLRWCGDANITLAIELSGDMTKMCPRVTDITFVANAKIRLSPLVNKIPGFAGIMFCMTKPPRIGYNLNMGAALGGSVVSNVVKPFIQNVVQYQIVNMLVWPQRLVIPVPLPELLLDPAVQLEVQRMALRNQGVLKVVVKAATGLKAADIALLGGKSTSDPFVEVSTDGKHVVRTKVVKKSLDPEWEQTFFLLVQEPTNQTMKVTVYDQDLSGDEIIGRTLVKLPPVCKEDKKELDSWYYLGPGDWADPAGCGKGNGKIHLAMMYRSIGSFLPNEPRDAVMGIAIVRVHGVSKMNFGKAPVILYCLVECNGEKWESGNASAKDGNDHMFNFNNIKEFYDVRFDMDIKVTVIQRAMGGAGNEEVGLFEMPITDIAESQDVEPFAGRPIPGFWTRHVRLEESDTGIIHMTLRYVPYI